MGEARRVDLTEGGEPGVAPAYGGRTARTNGAYERTKAVFNLHSCADLPKGL